MAFSTRREFLPRLGAAIGTGAILACAEPQREKTYEQILKEKILSFSWSNAEKPEQLLAFTEVLADGYLRLTKTPRLRKDDLTGQDKTRFYRGRNEFVNAIRTVESGFAPTENQWGYTHFSTRKVFIDIDSLKAQSLKLKDAAGLALVDGLWRQWAHLDITERTDGELLNNPNYLLFSPVSRRNELLKKYRGGIAYSDTYQGPSRFHEVWIETMTAQRMVEQVGLEEVILAGDLWNNGVDVFTRFTSAVGISFNTLYSFYTSSDFEGLAMLVGQQLPGTEIPLAKGITLFAAIQSADPEAIRRTGAFDVIENQRRKSASGRFDRPTR